MKQEVVLSSAVNKRLISRLMSSRSTTTTAEDNFALKGSNEFTSRSKNIFGGLNTLEEAHEMWISENQTHDNFQSSDEQYKSPFATPILKSMPISVLKKREIKSVEDSSDHKSDSLSNSSLFKKPQCPKMRRCRSNVINKGVNHGKKWTKYSLEDVPLSSNAANTSIALAFIDMLRKRKTDEQDIADKNEKILFSKPSQKECDSKMDNFSPGKIMISKSEPKGTSSTIKLDHLEKEYE